MSNQLQIKNHEGEPRKMNDSNNSLSHCKWNCKYHIVFAPKYRRQVIYGKIKTDIGQILRKLCTWKGVEIVEAELCPDHVHMLVKIPPKYSVSQFMGYLKGKSTLMIFDKHANLKYKYGRRQFWCDGYYVDTVTYFYGQFFYIAIMQKYLAFRIEAESCFFPPFYLNKR